MQIVLRTLGLGHVLRRETSNEVVRNFRLIQPRVITLGGGGVNRVMVSFRKFKQVNARDNYMQVYNNQYIDNCI